MNKILTLLIATIFILSACDNKKETADDKPTIKIGATLVLTGDGAEVGQAIKAGLEMKLDELKTKELKYDYELIFEDNQMIPMKAATTTNKLIFMDKANVILSMWETTGNAVAEICKTHNIICMACAFGEDTTRGKYNFNNMPSYHTQAKVMVDELKRRGIKSVALFADNSEIQDQFDALEKRLKEDGTIKVVFRDNFNPGEKDYKTAIAKAKQKQPEMYIMSGFPPSPFLFMKQLKEITGRNDNVTTIDIFVDMSKEHLPIVEGLWYVDSNTFGSDKYQNDLWAKKNIKPSGCSANIVSNLQIIIDAYEHAKIKSGEVIPDNDSIVDWIYKNVKNYDTEIGRVTMINEGLFDSMPTIKAMKNGKPTPI